MADDELATVKQEAMLYIPHINCLLLVNFRTLFRRNQIAVYYLGKNHNCACDLYQLTKKPIEQKWLSSCVTRSSKFRADSPSRLLCTQQKRKIYGWSTNRHYFWYDLFHNRQRFRHSSTRLQNHGGEFEKYNYVEYVRQWSDFAANQLYHHHHFH